MIFYVCLKHIFNIIIRYFKFHFVKEIALLTLAVKINHDEMNIVNAVGLILCLTGITLHVALKILRKNRFLCNIY